MSTELITQGYGDIKVVETREGHIGQSLLAKEHFAHYIAVADFLSKSSMVPKGMAGKPADILIAMEMGLQIGIPMMQAIQDIAVINGKPCMYGDGLLAVVQGHKDYEWIDEKVTSEGATCTIKRKNHEPHTVTFTQKDAKSASLWGKVGPWSQYPARMMQMRARGFCIRDTFSDALRGIKTDEEVQDYHIAETQLQKKAKAEDCLKGLLERKAEPAIAGPLILASDAQCETIVSLIESTGFSDERLLAALAYYDAGDIGDLSVIQAEDFITKLKGLK